MEGINNDYISEPNAIEKAAFVFKGSPIEAHLKKKKNHITIDDVAEYLNEMGIDTADADNEDFFEEVLDTIVNNGGIIDEVAYEDTPIDDNGHIDTEDEKPDITVVEESVTEDEDDFNDDDDDDDDNDDEDWDEEDEEEVLDEDFDYDKVASYAKNKPIASEPASDERVKSNKKPCANEPGKEVASDEKCKDKKGACTVEKDDKEDMMKFSDESLKNIVGVLADRIL